MNALELWSGRPAWCPAWTCELAPYREASGEPALGTPVLLPLQVLQMQENRRGRGGKESKKDDPEGSCQMTRILGMATGWMFLFSQVFTMQRQ